MKISQHGREHCGGRLRPQATDGAPSAGGLHRKALRDLRSHLKESDKRVLDCRFSDARRKINPSVDTLGVMLSASQRGASAPRPEPISNTVRERDWETKGCSREIEHVLHQRHAAPAPSAGSALACERRASTPNRYRTAEGRDVADRWHRVNSTKRPCRQGSRKRRMRSRSHRGPSACTAEGTRVLSPTLYPPRERAGSNSIRRADAGENQLSICSEGPVAPFRFWHAFRR